MRHIKFLFFPLLGLLFLLKMETGVELRILHASSLKLPLEAMAENFEQLHQRVKVRPEALGSVLAVRKVAELGKVADLVMVADYSLLEGLGDKYANWYIIFAKNSMVLAYTQHSKSSKVINETNWLEVLRSEGVKFGFSDPNLDPCGYRALIVLALAGGLGLVEENVKGIASEAIGEGLLIALSPKLEPEPTKVTIRPKSAELVARLQLGALDYAFIYESLALQHNLSYVDLPPELDLDSSNHSQRYERISVILGDGRVVRGKPILYAATIPTNAKNPEAAEEFLLYLLSPEGREVLRRNGMAPLAWEIGKLPKRFDGYVQSPPLPLS